MALIIDPDDLADSLADDSSQEVFINTSTLRIKLNISGALSTDGVTGRAVYSFLKEQWHDDPLTKNLAAFPFPFEPLGDESFELVDGWDWDSDATRELVRRAGWTVRDTSGNVTQQWAGIITLGALEPGTQVYYLQAGGSATDFALTGSVDQAIQILSDPNGDGAYGDGYDLRGALNLYARQQGDTYSASDLTDIGVTSLAGAGLPIPTDDTCGCPNHTYRCADRRRLERRS